VEIATSPEQLSKAKRIVLPGVGAFDWAISRLNASGLRDTLDELVLRQRVPVLGVCVGMQMMARGSEEGDSPGLAWIDAEVERFDSVQIEHAPLPHMGWNDVRPIDAGSLFEGIKAPSYYFLHSYCIKPRKPVDILAIASYGGDFAAAVRVGNVFGTQFHPEKSHQCGIDLLRNFAGI